MNIPKNSIRPFEPLGIPILSFTKYNEDLATRIGEKLLEYFRRDLQYELPSYVSGELMTGAKILGADQASCVHLDINEKCFYRLRYSVPHGRDSLIVFRVRNK